MSHQEGNSQPSSSASQGKADEVATWSIPEVSDQHAPKKKPRAKIRPKADASAELIEDVSGKVKTKPMTAEDLASISEEAKQEGYQAGHAEGLRIGKEEGLSQGLQEGEARAHRETKASLEQEAARLATIANLLISPLENQQALLEDIIVDMAVNFTKQLLEQELAHSPAALYQIAERALSALPIGANTISLYVNEADAALLETYIPEQDREWTIKIDNQLASGGCRVETAESLVDYSVEKRLLDYRNDILEAGAAEQEDIPEPESYRVETPSQDDAERNVGDDSQGDNGVAAE